MENSSLGKPNAEAQAETIPNDVIDLVEESDGGSSQNDSDDAVIDPSAAKKRRLSGEASLGTSCNADVIDLVGDMEYSLKSSSFGQFNEKQR